MRNATPQPPSANNPRSALGGPVQDVRCSPQPASTGRDSETAPEPHAEAADPSLPQPKPIPAAVPKAAPNAAPIPTSQPPAPLAPTRCADDSLYPRDAAQGVRSDRPPKASEAANAPQCPSADRCRLARSSAHRALPKAANDPTQGAPTTAPGSPTTQRGRRPALNNPIHDGKPNTARHASSDPESRPRVAAAKCPQSGAVKPRNQPRAKYSQIPPEGARKSHTNGPATESRVPRQGKCTSMCVGNSAGLGERPGPAQVFAGRA